MSSGYSPKNVSPKRSSSRTNTATAYKSLRDILHMHHNLKRSQSHSVFDTPLVHCPSLNEQKHSVAVRNRHANDVRSRLQFQVGLKSGIALGDCMTKLQRLQQSIEALCDASEGQLSSYDAKNYLLNNKKADASNCLADVSLSVSNLHETMEQHFSSAQRALESWSASLEQKKEDQDRDAERIAKQTEEMRRQTDRLLNEREEVRRQQKDLNEKMTKAKLTEAKLEAKEAELLELLKNTERKQLNRERDLLSRERKQFKEKAKKFKEHEHAFKEREDAFKEREDALCAAFAEQQLNERYDNGYSDGDEYDDDECLSLNSRTQERDLTPPPREYRPVDRELIHQGTHKRRGSMTVDTQHQNRNSLSIPRSKNRRTKKN